MSDHLQKLRDKAKQLFRSRNWDKLIPVLTEIIDLETRKDEKARMHTHRGAAYSSKGEYDHAIKDYDKATKLNPDDAKPYTGLGIAYFSKGEHDHAIKNYDKAIKLYPDDVMAYFGLGIVYFNKGECDRAIENHDKATENYDKAIENYDKTIENYDKAIENYDKAIKPKPKYAKAYYYRGMAYFSKGAHDHAIKDFLTVGKIDTSLESGLPFSYLAVRIRNILKEKKDKVKALELYGELLLAVITMQNDLFYKAPKDACSESFAHYTSLDALKSLTSKDSENDESCFRLYNAAYMNDPEEGRVFFEIIKKHGAPEDIEDMLYKNDKDRSLAYIGSFVKIDKDEENKDQLPLWRTYGKQDGQEAAGSCLIYKRVCFAERYLSQIGTMQQLQAMHNEQQRDGVRRLEERQYMQLPLYRIIYCSIVGKDDEIRFIYGKDKKIENLPRKLKELTNTLNEIVEFIKKRRSEERKNGLKDLACELLDSIRFLFKASHYSEEHEVRIIHTYYDRKDGEQELNPIKVDTKQIPPRFYFETSKSFSFDEVILGPMVQRVPEWKRWIKQQKTAIEVQKSKIKYGKIY